MAMQRDESQRYTALASIRVLELGAGAASYTGHFLADLGADAIKVEPPTGDPDRTRAPTLERGESRVSLHFLHFNNNKRSIVLDLTRARDRQTLLALVASADAIVESFSPGYLKSVGIGPGRLSRANPRLVVLSQTPFGQAGPFSRFRGPSPIVEAMSGYIYSIVGDDQRAPCVTPNDLLLQIAGLQGASSVLGAVRAARRDGVGQFIDMSLQEVGTHLAMGLAEYSKSKTIRRRPKPGRPYAQFPLACKARDGEYVLFLPVSVPMWRAFMAWSQDPILSSPEWESAEFKLQNLDVLQARTASFVAQFDADEFVREGQARRIPTSRINRPEDLFLSPQAQALGSFHEFDHPSIGSYRGIGYPYRLSASPAGFRSPAPFLDEHRDELIAESRARDHHSPVSQTRKAAFQGPLAGLRVLDFTHVLAGPVATRFLSSLGADVIKVEPLESVGRGPGASFADLNRGKKSIAVDARTEKGHEILLKLAEKSDVVIDNFSAGVMDRMGLGYAALSAANPSIIAIGINGWGREGPLSRWAAYGPTLETYTGLHWMWRLPDAPLEAGIVGPPSDYLVGNEAALAVMAALAFRDRTGMGQYIEVNMLEGIAHTLGPFYADAALTGRKQEPIGYQDQRYAPYGCYPCWGSDAWCVIACETDAEWEGLKKAMGLPGWAADPKFATKAGRQEARRELDEWIAAWTKQYTPRQVMHFLQREGAPAGAVQDAEALFHDNHLRARGHLVAITHPMPWGQIEHPRSAAQFSRSPIVDDLPVPALGQHNSEVLGSLLGLSIAEVERLQEVSR